MSAEAMEPASGDAVQDARSRGVVLSLPKIVVWVVAALVFVYVLWQAIGNMVGVVGNVRAFNDFVRSNHASSLQSSIPWAALIIDVLIAPAGYVIAWFVSRRMSTVRTVVVFVIAFAAVAALWFDILEYVSSTVQLGS